MSSFSRLFGMAARAVDKVASDSASPRSSGGGREWRDIVRSAADAVTGDRRDASPTPVAPTRPATSATPGRYAPPPASGASALSTEDRAAIARYDYLLRTADPDQVERLHREAFERLTPAQRSHVRSRMDADLAPHERPRSDAPADLARTAARAEAMRPGRMSSLLARAGRGGLVGAGVVGAGGLLAAVAGGAVLSTVAGPLLAHAGALGVDFTSLADGVDLESLAAGVDGGALGEWAGGAQEAASGFGEQVSGLGEQISGFELPGLGDLFGR